MDYSIFLIFAKLIISVSLILWAFKFLVSAFKR